MKYARVVSDTAIDVRTTSPEGYFTPDVAAQFVTVPDEVENGWLYDGSTWSAPPVPEPVDPGEPAPVYPKVSPVQFKLLFTSAERIAIKTAREADAVIDDFYDIVEDPRLTEVDLGLQSTQDALSYLVSQNLLTVERRAEILLGQVK